MNNKTEAKKVTLRPKQLKKVLRVAKKDYDGNFSLALRVMIDKFNEGTCDSCRHWNDGQCEKLVYFTDGGYTNNYMETEADFGCNRWEAKEEE